MGESKEINKTYIPGVCNIGKKHRRMRLISGITMLLFSLLYIVLVIVFGIPSIFRIVFIPIFFTGVLGVVQYRERFCAQFGLLGIYNYGDGMEEISRVQKEMRMNDLKKAVKIILISLAITLIASIPIFII